MGECINVFIELTQKMSIKASVTVGDCTKRFRGVFARVQGDSCGQLMDRGKLQSWHDAHAHVGKRSNLSPQLMWWATRVKRVWRICLDTSTERNKMQPLISVKQSQDQLHCPCMTKSQHITAVTEEAFLDPSQLCLFLCLCAKNLQGSISWASLWVCVLFSSEHWSCVSQMNSTF